MPYHLDFLNSNCYRKYPFAAAAKLTASNGVAIPVGLLSSCRVTTTYNKRNVFVSKIIIKDNKVNITLTDNNTGTALGCFNGTVDKDHQSLVYTSFTNDSFATATFGLVSTLQLQGDYVLDYDNGRLEDSVVFCFTRPLVEQLVHNGTSATGNVEITGDNITVTTSPSLLLSVTDKSLVVSAGDKSSVFGNCGTPVITKIGNVSPDSNGNIDIYGISPVTIAVTASGLQVGTGTLTFDDLCQARQARLAPTSTSNTYYADILTITEPEWKTW